MIKHVIVILAFGFILTIAAHRNVVMQIIC